MNEAADTAVSRQDQEIVFRVVSSYYDVLLAAKELEVAEQLGGNRQLDHGPQPGEIRQRADRRVRSAPR